MKLIHKRKEMQFFNKVMEINFLNTNNWPLLLKEQDLMNRSGEDVPKENYRVLGKLN